MSVSPANVFFVAAGTTAERGKLLPAGFVAWICWSPAGHSEVLPADLMAASVQPAPRVALFYWQFLLFVAAGTTAERGKLLPADFVAAFLQR